MENSMRTKTVLTRASLLALATSLASIPVQAADLGRAPIYYKAPPIEPFNPWMIRLRVLGVLPDTAGSSVSVVGAPSLSSPSSGLSISDQAIPELDITYFFTKNVAAELILGVTSHHISGNGALTGLDIGQAWLLPPTLTLQYHFTDFGALKPYIGAGINYTAFFNQSAANTSLAGLAVTDLRISNQFGAAVQFGFDYMLDRNWGLNFDVKKLWLRPEYSATVNNAIAVTGRANIDPWLVSGGVTYKF
ncbi:MULTISPECIES: OmpW family outer membrane protein [unclassified Bradyrhizobium]|uniref:OmpW/AlkL family protein n=1 Tax=unclassified Bradyrhizobium TaxID=2631580 RepID=UPI0024791460|nr:MULTISPECIES: OmpW family outer membrane protein [unclassified Bradyrhizobium]WGR72742.1 OmpW family protein [Bradyrhizobium sp. ISRA426]WGR77576.1 OmpW family protein [Bradyrhizobium sp. ISRA430]WGR87982.1 OmpW family protein [Bradyrhizobium sp. ISRA432]